MSGAQSTPAGATPPAGVTTVTDTTPVDVTTPVGATAPIGAATPVRATPPLARSLLAGAGDLTYQCIRCGFCLPACPTYGETLLEPESPRGRIALVRAAFEGTLSLADIAPHLDLCIGCRACESACPAGVQYGAILEQARAAIEAEVPRPRAERLARRVGVSWVLGSPRMLHLARWLLWGYQATGLRRLVRATGLLRRLSPSLAELEGVLPPLPPPWHRHARAGGAGGAHRSARPPARGRVAFFLGCVQEVALSEVSRAAIRVLEAAGFEVVVPEGQGCCGAVHAHAGQLDRARQQAVRNIEAFERVSADYIVNIAGGCGAQLKEYPKLVAHARTGATSQPGAPGMDGADREWVDRARRFAARVRDFSELLADVPLPSLGPVEGVVTYQDSCHLRHVQKVVDPPRRLLQRIPGLKYVELPEADRCCGAGGIYNLTQPEMSRQVLERKMAHVRRTGATILAVANTPCHLQLLVGARRSGLDRQGLRVRHIAELLDEAIARGRAEQGGGDGS